MKKRLTCALLALCLCLAALGGCGEKQPPDASPEDAFRRLLAADYEVYSLIYGGGLTVDSSQGGTGYQPVNSAGYETIDALQKRLESIYLRSETVRDILEAPDQTGAPLLKIENGQLLRSARPTLLTLGYEVDDTSIQAESQSDSAAAFLFQETGLDGSLYRTRLSMTKTAGGWRLDAPRWEAERTLIREGSDQDSLVEADAARLAAEEFLASVVNGSLPQDQSGMLGDLSAWQEIKVSSAKVTETVEEGDSWGDYRVAVTVENGAGVFPEGEQQFRLVMNCNEMRYGDRVYPAYFRPASEEYYNWGGYVEQNQDGPGPAWYVDAFIGFYGSATFATPWDLPPETVVEFSLLFAQSSEGDQRYTPAELDAAIQKTFGITGFDGRGTKFYVKEQDRYLLWGRGGNIYDLLIQPPRIRSSQAQVDVTFYGDVLCTAPLRTLRYTLEKNHDGSWMLLSAQRVDDTTE